VATQLFLEASRTHPNLEGSILCIMIGSNIEYVRVHLFYYGYEFAYISIV